MYRATTPLHRFIFAEDPSTYQAIKITYAQGKRTILEKTKDDLIFLSEESANGLTRYSASVRLTQEETKLFSTDYGNTISVQIRAMDAAGHVYASDVNLIALKDVLNDEVLE